MTYMMNQVMIREVKEMCKKCRVFGSTPKNTRRRTLSRQSDTIEPVFLIGAMIVKR